MATITRLSFIPARCWIAPEMPTAMYSSGATIFPVCPTCQSFGTKPASTAARMARIDGAHESARAHDGDDVGALRDIEQRRNARGEVLSEGIRRSEDMRVPAGEAHDEGGKVLGELIPVMRRVRDQDLLDARDR